MASARLNLEKREEEVVVNESIVEDIHYSSSNIKVFYYKYKSDTNMFIGNKLWPVYTKN